MINAIDEMQKKVFAHHVNATKDLAPQERVLTYLADWHVPEHEGYTFFVTHLAINENEGWMFVGADHVCRVDLVIVTRKI